MSDVINTKSKDILITIKINHLVDEDSDCEDLGGFQEDAEEYCVHRPTGKILGKHKEGTLKFPHAQYGEITQFIKSPENYTFDWDARIKFVNDRLAELNLFYEDNDIEDYYNADTLEFEIDYSGYEIIGQIGAGKGWLESWKRYFATGEVNDYKSNYDYMRLVEVKTHEEAHAYAIKVITEDYLRFEAWADDHWSYIGIQAVIEDQDGDEMAQAALWGIPSDMDKDEIRATEIEMLSDALAEIGIDYIDVNKFMEGDAWNE